MKLSLSVAIALALCVAQRAAAAPAPEKRDGTQEFDPARLEHEHEYKGDAAALLLPQTAPTEPLAPSPSKRDDADLAPLILPQSAPYGPPAPHKRDGEGHHEHDIGHYEAHHEADLGPLILPQSAPYGPPAPHKRDGEGHHEHDVGHYEVHDVDPLLMQGHSHAAPTELMAGAGAGDTSYLYLPQTAPSKVLIGRSDRDGVAHVVKTRGWGCFSCFREPAVGGSRARPHVDERPSSPPPGWAPLHGASGRMSYAGQFGVDGRPAVPARPAGGSPERDPWRTVATPRPSPPGSPQRVASPQGVAPERVPPPGPAPERTSS